MYEFANLEYIYATPVIPMYVGGSSMVPVIKIGRFTDFMSSPI